MWRRGRRQGAAAHDGAQAAAALALHLQHGGALASIQVADLPLAPGEVALADVTCSAARYYGTEVVYPRPTGYFENHPVFGQRWVTNHRLDARRSHAVEAAAAPQWRDHTPARLVLTSAGVRLRPVSSPDWLPFDHVLLTEVAMGHEDVVLKYTVCAPLHLAGPAAPWLGVAVEHLRQTMS